MKLEIKFFERHTDYDVLNHDDFSWNIINRHDDNSEQITIAVYGKTIAELINYVKGL
ncbi:MAG: hypothetical protein LBS69_06015 [Prevotellaceae bacterium]|jgi:hypothetical protein|nr:hypothetical protein [Prevotellaceae bacterium]